MKYLFRSRMHVAICECMKSGKEITVYILNFNPSPSSRRAANGADCVGPAKHHDVSGRNYYSGKKNKKTSLKLFSHSVF